MHACLSQQGQMRLGAKAAVGHEDLAGAPGWRAAAYRGELMRAQGAASMGKTLPVPACNNAHRWATGQPHPGRCWLGWPQGFGRTGISGMEQREPSTQQGRWPHQPPASRGWWGNAWLTERSSRSHTVSGSCMHAGQEAEAVTGHGVR